MNHELNFKLIQFFYSKNKGWCIFKAFFISWWWRKIFWLWKCNFFNSFQLIVFIDFFKHISSLEILAIVTQYFKLYIFVNHFVIISKTIPLWNKMRRYSLVYQNCIIVSVVKKRKLDYWLQENLLQNLEKKMVFWIFHWFLNYLII